MDTGRTIKSQCFTGSAICDVRGLEGVYADTLEAQYSTYILWEGNKTSSSDLDTRYSSGSDTDISASLAASNIPSES